MPGMPRWREGGRARAARSDLRADDVHAGVQRLRYDTRGRPVILPRPAPSLGRVLAYAALIGVLHTTGSGARQSSAIVHVVWIQTGVLVGVLPEH